MNQHEYDTAKRAATDERIDELCNGTPDAITEAQVMRWLSDELTRLRADTGHNVTCIAIDASRYNGTTSARVTLHALNDLGTNCIGYSQPSLAEAVAKLNANIEQTRKNAVELRETAALMLAQAEEMERRAAE